MARELRISAIIALPEGPFQEAEAIVAMREPIEAFRGAVTNLNGTLDVEVVTPKPRGEKAAS